MKQAALLIILCSVVSLGIQPCLAKPLENREVYIKVLSDFTPAEEIRKEVLSFFRSFFPRVVVSDVPSPSVSWIFVTLKEKQQRDGANKFLFRIFYRLSLSINTLRNWRFVTEGTCNESDYGREWRRALRKLLIAFRAKWKKSRGRVLPEGKESERD